MIEALSACDPCFWIYVGISAISLYGCFLFIWWWGKIGRASEVFMYVTVLLGATFIYNIFNAFARYLKEYDLIRYLTFIESDLWKYRAIPQLIILVLIVFRMNLRAFKTIRKVKRFKLEEEKNVQSLGD